MVKMVLHKDKLYKEWFWLLTFKMVENGAYIFVKCTLFFTHVTPTADTQPEMSMSPPCPCSKFVTYHASEPSDPQAEMQEGWHPILAAQEI